MADDPSQKHYAGGGFAGGADTDNWRGYLTPTGTVDTEVQRAILGSLVPTGLLTTRLVQFYQSASGTVGSSGKITDNPGLSGAGAPLAGKLLQGEITPLIEYGFDDDAEEENTATDYPNILKEVELNDVIGQGIRWIGDDKDEEDPNWPYSDDNEIAPSGSLTTSVIYYEGLSGSITPTGSPTNDALIRYEQAVSGSITPAGSVSAEIVDPNDIEQVIRQDRQAVEARVIATWADSRFMDNLFAISTSEQYTEQTNDIGAYVHWHLNEVNGTEHAIDYSSNGNLGEYNGTITYEVDGALSGADIDNDAIGVNDASPGWVSTSNANLALTNDFSFEIWAQAAENSRVMHLGGEGTGLTGGSYGFGIEATAGGYFQAKLSNGTSLYSINSDSVFTTNQWYHLVLVADSGELRFYINGVSQGTPQTFTGDVNGDRMFSVGTIGTLSSNYWHGLIDQPALLSRAMDDDEVDIRYKAANNDGTHTHNQLFGPYQLGNAFKRESYPWAVADGGNRECEPIVANGKTYYPSCEDPGQYNYGWMSRQISDEAGVFSTQPEIILKFDQRKATDITIYNSEELSKTKDIAIWYLNSSDTWVSLGPRTFPEEGASITQSINSGVSTNIKGVKIKISSIYGCSDVARLMQISPELKTDISLDIIDLNIDETREDYDSSVPFGITAANSFDITLDNTELTYSKHDTTNELHEYIIPDVQMDVELGWAKPTEPMEYFKYGTFYVDEWQESTDGMTVTAQCRDYSKYMQEQEMQNQLWENVTAAEAITDIARSSGVASTDLEYVQSYSKAINKDNPLALWPFFDGQENARPALSFSGFDDSYAAGTQWKFPAGNSTTEFWIRTGIGYNLDLTSSKSQYADLADEPSFELDKIFVNDFDIRFKMRMDDWSNGQSNTVMSMWNLTGDNRKIAIRIDASGDLTVNISDDGVNNYSDTLDLGTIGNRGTRWIRITGDLNTGSGDSEFKTWVSQDHHLVPGEEGFSWGDPVDTQTTATNMTSMYHGDGDANSPVLRLGAMGAGSYADANLMQLYILDGIGGNQIYGINLEEVPPTTATYFYDQYNNKWTLANGAKISAAGSKTTSSVVDQDAIISYETYSSQTNEFLIFDPNNIRVYINGANQTSGVDVNDGEWHHVAITRRKSDNQINIYKDGELESTFNIPGSAGYSIRDGGYLMFMQEQDGRARWTPNNQSLRGALSDVRIWSTILDQDTIKQNRFRRLPNYNENLDIYYPFDEGDMDEDEDPNYKYLNNVAYAGGLDINDAGWTTRFPQTALDHANTYNIGLYGTVVWNDFDEEYYPVFKNAQDKQINAFLGPDGYAKLDYYPEFELSAKFTLEGWFYKINSESNSMLTLWSNNEDDDNPLSTGSIVVLLKDSTNQIIVNSHNIESVIGTGLNWKDNDWNHVVITYGISDFHHNENSISIYVNGVQEAHEVATIGFTANTNPWLIGYGSVPAQYSYWDGGVSNVAMYDYDLTSSQVIEHFNSGNTYSARVFRALWVENQTAWDAMNEIATADLGIFYFDRDSIFNYVNARDYYNDEIDKYANPQLNIDDQSFIISESHQISLLTNKVIVKISPEISGVGAYEEIWTAPDGESLASGRLQKSLLSTESGWLYYQTRKVALPGTNTKITTPVWKDSGYVKIDDEIIGYNGKTGKKLKNLTRGMFGTDVADHIVPENVKQGPRIREVREYNIEYGSAPAINIKDPFITAVDFDETVDIEKWRPEAFKAYLLISRNEKGAAFSTQYLQRVDPETDIENYFVISGIPVIPSTQTNDNLAIEEASASIDNAIRRHQLKEMEITNKYITSVEYAQEIADFVILHYENPVPIIEVETMGIPILELGDRIKITTLQRAGMVNEEYWIEEISTSFDGGIQQNMRLREVDQ